MIEENSALNRETSRINDTSLPSIPPGGEQ